MVLRTSCRSSNEIRTYSSNHEQNRDAVLTDVSYVRESMSSRGVENIRKDAKDKTPPTRRRIPVACGRCRKRKIRCSGDPGNNMPCENCRAVGNDDCQFLRVASTEAQMKVDPMELPYDLSTSRNYLRMSSLSSHYPSYVAVNSPGSDGYPAYRHSSNAVHYQPVRCYGVPNSVECQNIDYRLSLSDHPLVDPAQTTVAYPNNGSSRVWADHHSQKNASLFLEQQVPYAYTGATPSLHYRPGLNSNSKTGSSNASSAFQSGPERALPVPPIHRATHTNNDSLRPSDNGFAIAHPQTEYTDHSMVGGNASKVATTIASPSKLGYSYVPLLRTSSDITHQMCYDGRGTSSSHANHGFASQFEVSAATVPGL